MQGGWDKAISSSYSVEKVERLLEATLVLALALVLVLALVLGAMMVLV